MNNDSKIILPYSESCFVCGKDNEAGLRTKFYVEDGLVKMRLNAREEHCGYLNMVHGGVVAAALDECMGWASGLAVGRMCFTAELTIRYVKPVPADRSLVVSAEVVKANRCLASAQGRIIDDDGVEYVKGQGRFVPLSDEESQLVDEYLIYDGGLVPPFARLCEDLKSREES